MSALADLQRGFAETLQSDADLSDAGLDGGYAVYRNTYRAQMMACLRDTFPVLAAWAGEARFDELAIGYALHCPPQSWSLDHFPARFADWLTERGADATTVDLARIEWALTQSFVARDGPVLTLDDLPAVDWDRAVLGLAEATHVLALASPAAAIWQAHQNDAPCPEDAPQAGHVLIWREGEMCALRELDATEADLLAMLPASFARLCAAASDTLGEAAGAERMGATLVQWLGDGLITLV